MPLLLRRLVLNLILRVNALLGGAGSNRRGIKRLQRDTRRGEHWGSSCSVRLLRLRKGRRGRKGRRDWRNGRRKSWLVGSGGRPLTIPRQCESPNRIADGKEASNQSCRRWIPFRANQDVRPSTANPILRAHLATDRGARPASIVGTPQDCLALPRSSGVVSCACVWLPYLAASSGLPTVVMKPSGRIICTPVEEETGGIEALDIDRRGKERQPIASSN